LLLKTDSCERTKKKEKRKEKRKKENEQKANNAGILN
jgi:hypothetical protein